MTGRRRIKTTSSELLDAPAPTGLREMAALQEANPEAFAAMMRAALEGGEEPQEAWERATAAATEEQPRMPDELRVSDRLVSPDGTSRPAQQASKLVTPTPGFVVKTRGHKKAELRSAREDETKYFINVCSHPDVAAPSEEKRLDESGEEVEGVSVPVSIGPEKLEVDHAGQDCVAVDCIVHPSTMENREFLCHLVLTYVEKKYGLALDRQFKLPRLKYKGDVVSRQKIRDDSNRVRAVAEVTQVPEEPIVPPLGPAPALKRALVDGTPTTDTLWVSSARELRVELDCSSWRGAKVAHSAFALRAQVPGHAEARFTLPVSVRLGSARSSFPDRRTLVLAFEIERDFGREPDPGSKPFMVARALGGPETSPQKQEEPIAADVRFHLVKEGRPACELPPKGASAAELAYAAVERARVAAESADAVGEDDVLPEDKFHRADILSQHYIAQRRRQSDEVRSRDPDVDRLDLDDYRAKEQEQKSAEDIVERRDEEPPRVLPAATSFQPSGIPLQSSLWAELL